MENTRFATRPIFKIKIRTGSLFYNLSQYFKYSKFFVVVYSIDKKEKDRAIENTLREKVSGEK